jgi:type II secretory pathway pseudopilin PulG
MAIVVISILAFTVLPKFLDFTDQAEIARGEANVGALKSATYIFYATSALNEGAPRFPSDSQELEDQILWDLEWEEGGGYTYNGNGGVQ